MFAVVDIETTGGVAARNRIIEVAIVTVEDGEITDTYSTLINPGEPVSPFITSLTGITNAMLCKAPLFVDVAQIIEEKTRDKIFVAHNVNFDYNFLKLEFERVGIRFDRKKLCTVRLSRKIFPGFRSYGLGTLATRLGLQIQDRHRALGDAEATARILKLLLENDVDGFIRESLRKTSREATLPAHISREVFENLPQQTGVYYFHDRRGKVLYVGKAKNIKSRVIGHFTGDSGREKRLFHENVADISYELTGNELIALLHESREIKRLWPEYNRVQKFSLSNYGLFTYPDRNGYKRFVISKIQPGAGVMVSFRSLQEGRNFLNDWVMNYHLCPKLCGLQKSENACFNHTLGQCDGACAGKIAPQIYNERTENALESLKQDKLTFAILGKGRDMREKSLVLVENGIYLGHGFTENQILNRSFEELKSRIEYYSDNHDIQKILLSHLKRPNGDEVIFFENSW